VVVIFTSDCEFISTSSDLTSESGVDSEILKEMPEEVNQVGESTVEREEEVFIDLTERPTKVLLVDDESDLLKVAKSCLEMEGPFQVETALRVEETMKKMEKEL
jgi:PleD family two-component response regulator